MKKHFHLLLLSGIPFILIVTTIIICFIPGNFIQSGILVEVMNSSGDYVATEASQNLFSGLLAALFMAGSALGFVAIYQFGSIIVEKEKLEAEKNKDSKQ